MNIKFLFILCVVINFGCLHRTGSITTPSGSVIGVPDAGKPATLASDTKLDSLTLPAGTTVTTTKLEAIASIPATQSSPAIPYQPAREITIFTVPKEVKWDRSQTKVNASTGTVDTSIAEKRIDSQESRPLLYAALASLVAAGFFIYRAYPTPALISGAASVVFFLAWKVSGMPEWFWAVGAIGLAAGGFLYLGHERGLNTTIITTPPSK